MAPPSRGAANTLIATASALLAALARACALAGPARASSGGSAPGATTTKPTAKGTGAHVTSVRITSVACIPEAHCSGNPHQVSLHGTLLLKGIDLKAGMTLGFPKKAGARVTTASPQARLRTTTAGLVATVLKAAHSGHLMILLSQGRYRAERPDYLYNHAQHPPPKPVVSPVTAGGGKRGRSKARGCGSGT